MQEKSVFGRFPPTPSNGATMKVCGFSPSWVRTGYTCNRQIWQKTIVWVSPELKSKRLSRAVMLCYYRLHRNKNNGLCVGPKWIMLMPSFVTCGQLVGKLKYGACTQRRNLIGLPLFPLSKTQANT